MITYNVHESEFNITKREEVETECHVIWKQPRIAIFRFQEVCKEVMNACKECLP